jgi:hypothetical protein
VFLVLLAFEEIVSASLSIGIGGPGGVFVLSLFIGVTSGMAFSDIAGHLLEGAARQPALYAAAAIGALLACAARASAGTDPGRDATARCPCRTPTAPYGRDRGKHRTNLPAPGHPAQLWPLALACPARLHSPCAARHIREAAYPRPEARIPGRTFMCAVGKAGEHDSPDVPGTGRSQKCSADLLLRAESATSIITRKYPAASIRVQTILPGRRCPAQLARNLLWVHYQ